MPVVERPLLLWAVLCLSMPSVMAQETPPSDSSAEAADVAPNLTGFWSGNWSSCTNGHNGPMSARFCPIDATHYQVHFTGRFFKLFPFNYTAVLTVTGTENGRVLLSGSHHLGPLLGTFSYNAWATETQFVAGYYSRKDQGQFVMTRCSN